MTVTPEPLPAAYGMGRVVARFLDAVGDGADADTLPEAVPATGTVMFTPIESDRIVPDATAEPTPIITHKPIEAALDAGGYLSRNGTRGLWLWAGQWLVTFSIPGMARQGWTIEVTTAHTELAPLDLWLSQPYTPPSGATVTTMLVPANPVDGYGLVWDAAEGRLVWGPVGGAGGSTSPATATTLGTIKLAGDLAGTAAAPTVPGLADKADSAHTHAPADVMGTAVVTTDPRLTDARTPLAHGHSVADVTGLQGALDGKQPAGSYAASGHTHTLADVTDYTAPDLSGYATTASLATVATTGAYADLAGKPTIPDSPDDIGAAPVTQPINAQAGAYTLTASDAGKLVTVTAATSVDVTVPAGVFAAGQRVDVLDLGAERVTFVAGSGMTLGGTPTLVSRAQYSAHSVVFLSASQAVVVGDLEAA